ncbi:hypothetical protein CLV42_11834 [Chitinophaga ginsengisoli]|uniref:Uncharacterized protein n=1 Tax=Chitinophaga ginsengisoli TaxID=363837 RepID=A0A2P8FNP0_9BACT|nr:hypothetical protein CLV42_11834 [Chitinophaga ginsengisoli]
MEKNGRIAILNRNGFNNSETPDTKMISPLVWLRPLFGIDILLMACCKLTKRTQKGY